MRKSASCGSVESNDCLVTVTESDSTNIKITSIVDAFFHENIKAVITNTLKELNIKNIDVEVNDKGALDYTIKARLVTAIERLVNEND